MEGSRRAGGDDCSPTANGDLIDELEGAVPDAQSADAVLRRLEDLQAVITPIVFASKEEQERIFVDPQYQQLYATVMRQLTHRTDDQPIALPTPSDLIIDPEP